MGSKGGGIPIHNESGVDSKIRRSGGKNVVTAQEGPGPPRDAVSEPLVAPTTDPAPTTQASGAVVPRTRASSVWVALAVGLVLLVVVLVFILENLHPASAAFFGAHWRIPLGLDLLLAAVLGGLVVFTLGAVRIVQLRRVARRHHRARVRAESEVLEGGQANSATGALPPSPPGSQVSEAGSSSPAPPGA